MNRKKHSIDARSVYTQNDAVSYFLLVLSRVNCFILETRVTAMLTGEGGR